jgi:hypothetical protein
MKVACVTTTINVPDVLRLYAAADPAVHFFVVGDRKTPNAAVANMLLDIPEHSYYGVGMQHRLGYKCSELIGYNSIQRRNIGFLEAAKWGADVVVSVDDDNVPLNNSYFSSFVPLQPVHTELGAAKKIATNRYSIGQHIPGQLFNGIMASSSSGWFDVGQLLNPPASHRGFPHDIKSKANFTHVTNAKIGVMAGMCLGDPDIGATTRIVNAPIVHGVSELLRAGIVVDPTKHTVFNSQNTAIIRELLPAWGMIPFVGRYDDIYASLICHRVMRDRDLYVHYGQPFVWQQRNAHNLVKDLRGEIDGMENITKLASILDHTILLGKTIIDDCRAIWTALEMAEWMPRESIAAMRAYIADCETIGL